MVLWPFSRKGSRKRSPGRGRQDVDTPAPQRAMTEPAAAAAPASSPMPAGPTAPSSGSGRAKSKRQRDSSSNKKLQRRGRTYSFSPGRRDSIRVARARQESVPPLPAGPIPASMNDINGVGGQGPSRPMKDTGITERTPTLHHNNSRKKRMGQPLPQRKSSKRRKEDNEREAEVKAMSHSYSTPTRPATDSWIAGRPTKRESARTRHWHQPDSVISLPTPESIDSSMSSDSDHISFRVSALQSLAPRPTIRYGTNPLYAARSQSGPVRSTSTKRKTFERDPISESTLKAHKRVDDLANDLDASDLRELMERDKRRRERKREKERERIERRLTRRAERQKAEEAEAKRNGTPPPQNLERGVLGRESPPSTHDNTSAVVTSSRRRQSTESARTTKQPVEESNFRSGKRSPSPLDKFHRVDSMGPEPIESPTVPEYRKLQDEEKPVSKSSRSPSPKLMDFIRSKKRRSKSPTQPELEQGEERPTNAEATRLVSESESGGRPSDSGSSNRAWMSIFRWGRSGKSRRGSGPSSFSNTSRDSMLASQTTSQISNYTPIQRANSKVPKRTMSRFREDLPELPLSPPDSRVASPEADSHLAEPLPAIPDDVAMRYDTPTSGHRATPSSLHRDDMQASPAPHSMSLASIDSEGSWLSGRPNRKRASSGMHGSLANYPLRSVSGDSMEHDDETVNDDDFLKIVDDKKNNRKSTGDARPSSDEEDDEQSPKWGDVTRTPAFTHRETMRSREGLLLQSFDDDTKEFRTEKDSESNNSFGGESPTFPERATSVNFGKGHIRNFSAGSAKLLELSPRPSTDRRLSNLESGTQ